MSSPDRRSAAALEVSGQLLAEVLADRQLAADADRERLAQLGGTAVAGAAILGLFAAFAAIPPSGEGVFDPNAAAGSTTLLLALAVALSAMAVHKSMAMEKKPGKAVRLALKAVGLVLLVGVMGTAAAAMASLLPASLPLLLALTLVGLAGTCALLAARVGRDRSGS